MSRQKERNCLCWLLTVQKKNPPPPSLKRYNESETLIKFEIMDGCPVRGESIPVRLFLNSCVEHLTPTYRNVHTKFSVKYYLNLVLIDQEVCSSLLWIWFVFLFSVQFFRIVGISSNRKSFCGASLRARKAKRRTTWQDATSAMPTLSASKKERLLSIALNRKSEHEKEAPEETPKQMKRTTFSNLFVFIFILKKGQLEKDTQIRGS